MVLTLPYINESCRNQSVMLTGPHYDSKWSGYYALSGTLFVCYDHHYFLYKTIPMSFHLNEHGLFTSSPVSNHPCMTQNDLGKTQWIFLPLTSYLSTWQISSITLMNCDSNLKYIEFSKQQRVSIRNNWLSSQRCKPFASPVSWSTILYK